MKVWNSVLTVVTSTLLTSDEEIWCLMTSTFVPEKQLKEAKKYVLVNEWNRGGFLRPYLYVGESGDVTMERGFAIQRNWKWGTVYAHFASEMVRFLETIDKMSSTLRVEEDAAKET